MQMKKELKMDKLKRYQEYIEDLYSSEINLTKARFISQTGWKDFILVIDDDVARFLKLILQMKRPMNILEIGTSIGFSTTSMALVVREYGGEITTIEFDKKAYNQANDNFVKAGVKDVIKSMLGDACEVVPKLPSSSFDLIFQDVDKRLYPKLLNDCIRILKPGGMLIADDTLFPVMDLDERWNDQIEPIHRFNQLVTHSVQLDSTLLPIGDGIIVSVKGK